MTTTLKIRDIELTVGIDKFLSLFDTGQWYNTFHPILTQEIKDKFNELSSRQNSRDVSASEHAQ